jgi:hypothetical protein
MQKIRGSSNAGIPPLVLIHDGSGTTTSYHTLANFDLGSDLYAIEYPLLDAAKPWKGGIASLAEAYSALIEMELGRSPVMLGGKHESDSFFPPLYSIACDAAGSYQRATTATAPNATLPWPCHSSSFPVPLRHGAAPSGSLVHSSARYSVRRPTSLSLLVNALRSPSSSPDSFAPVQTSLTCTQPFRMEFRRSRCTGDGPDAIGQVWDRGRRRRATRHRLPSRSSEGMDEA